MMIAQVGEFASSTNNANGNNKNILSSDYESNTDDWTQKKSYIIDYMRSIHYKACDEWQYELENVGFNLCATLYYRTDGAGNPQKLFYAVYQLNKS